jgi:hydrogenase maturation factor
MATSGFAPQYAQLVLNLPTELSLKEFDEYWHYIHVFCEQTGIAITGGHTGQIPGQNSTISGGGTMFLVAPENEVLTSDQAQPGDLLVMTKSAALTASSILALNFPQTIERAVGTTILQAAQSNFYRTSSLAEALLARNTLVPRRTLCAMHDVTEGGIVGAVQEMAAAAGCGYVLKPNRIPVYPEVQAVCGVFGIDPLCSVGAGSMLMAVKRGSESQLLPALAAQGIPATVIGFFTEAEEGKRVLINGLEQEDRELSEDPYWAAYFKAYQAGWK